MLAHFLTSLTNGSPDPGNVLMVVVIGVAGGFFLGEIRLGPLRRVLLRVIARRPDGDGPRA